MGTIDTGLQRQLYLRRADPAAPMEVPAESGRPKILVRFSGDAADLENAGMHIETVVGDIDMILPESFEGRPLVPAILPLAPRPG